MAHEGTCYRNSTLAPSNAEVPLGAKIARDLLVDEDGEYVGDDLAIFCVNLNSDNDATLPNKFIEVQNRIIGEAADGKAEHIPDGGHVTKCQNNEFFRIREKDPSFKGNHALSNLRIRSLNSMVKRPIKKYREAGVGNEAARKKCLDQIGAVITHSCGDHSKCFDEEFCTHLKVKREHPDWSNEEIQSEVAKTTRLPFGGKNMSLSNKGIATLESALSKRYNVKSIDKIAKGGCSNLSEMHWSVNGKFSEGKRKCEDHTDMWQTTNKLTFCRTGDGNVADTHSRISSSLGLSVNSVQSGFLAGASKRKDQVRARQTSDKFLKNRIFRKMARDHLMGKTDTKSCYRSEKLPLSKSSKSSVGKKAARSPFKCSNCVLEGHKCNRCQLPLVRKRKVTDLVDWDLDELNFAESNGVRARKRRKELDLVPIDEWL